ncbi:phage major capsid protein [Cloacibacillus sp. An23]|uniref:phage major capsid protein n=1 Tax=Cloacibacillus sp. An23 TaxID=1965591 RepID=UPI000B37E19B|nr:phage major capsid protein [Cloacibacillus sp. An23]OUO91832.1 phage major capsid protein [Cloacibacillus sp. An23]
MDKKAKLKAVFEQMKALNDSDSFSQEKWDELKAEAAKLKAEIEAEEKRAEEMRSLGGFINAAPMPASMSISPSPAVPKDKNERPFNSFGEQLQAVARLAGSPDVDYPVDVAENKQTAVNSAAGIRTSIASEVGFLVQTDFATQLRESATESGVLASRVSRIPIGANSDGFEYMEVDDKDRSKGPWGGAFKVYRKGEAEEMKAGETAKMKTRDIRLEDLYGLLYVTNRALRDATALGSLIRRGYADNFGFKLDQEIFEGSGAGQCLGILNSKALVTVAKETNQAAKTINVQNILKMFYSMPARFLPNAVWLVSQVGVQEVLPQLAINDNLVYMPPTGLSGGLYGTLLGRPVIPCEHCPEIGTKGDILLADLNQYLMIEKGNTEIETSIHVKFVTDETAFRFIQRNNGQPWDGSPWKTLKGNKLMGPFVALADRA